MTSVHKTSHVDAEKYMQSFLFCRFCCIFAVLWCSLCWSICPKSSTLFLTAGVRHLTVPPGVEVTETKSTWVLCHPSWSILKLPLLILFGDFQVFLFFDSAFNCNWEVSMTKLKLCVLCADMVYVEIKMVKPTLCTVYSIRHKFRCCVKSHFPWGTVWIYF